MKVPRVTQNKKRIILYGIEYRVKGRKELSDKIAEEVFMTSSQLKWRNEIALCIRLYIQAACRRLFSQVHGKEIKNNINEIIFGHLTQNLLVLFKTC